MTQPDQYLPDTAINATPGFAAYAGMTQEEYEQMLAENAANIFTPITGLCELLFELPFMSGLGELGGQGGLFGIFTGVQDFVDSMCSLFTGSASPGTTPDTVTSGVAGVTALGSEVLTGSSTAATSGVDLLAAGRQAINQNTARHVGAQSLTTAQSVSLKQENLLISQAFTYAYDVAVDPDGHWVHNDADGAVTLGCLQVTCNGTQLDYVSNEVPVVVGETITLSCFAKCGSLAYTGSHPVRFGVQKYRAGKTAAGSATFVDVGGYDVDTLESPAATTGWLELAGTYTVQPGVDQLRFRFSVAANATSGTVKFDEANFLKTDLIADECVPGVGLTVDNIVTELYGSTGEGFTHNAAAIALANTASALVSVSAELAALKAEGYTGAVAGDDFNGTGEITASSNWDGGYSTSTSNGYYTMTDGNAEWVPAGLNPLDTSQECWFGWTGTDAVTDDDYQVVQTILASAPQSALGLLGEEFRAWTYIYGRRASDWSSYIRAGFCSDGTWDVGHKANAGASFVAMDSGTCAVPGSSSTLSLYCGDKASAAKRHFTLKVGTAIITEFDEVGTASPLGASNRRTGWGGKCEGGLAFIIWTFLPMQGTPPKINQWLGMDQ